MFKSKTEINKDDIQELYYMTSIKNLPSILQNGILSHRRIGKLSANHTDVSNQEVQQRRAWKNIERVEENKPPKNLHSFAPLYLNPHNAMMFVLRSKHDELCVIRVRKEILDRRNAILSNRNAAIDRVTFFTPSAFQLSGSEVEYISSSIGYSKNDSESQREDRKQTRQAEALIPYNIQSEYFIGFFVSNDVTKQKVESILSTAGKNLPIATHPTMFFQKSGFPPALSDFDVLSTDATFKRPPSPTSSDDESDDIGEPHPLKRQRV